MKTITKTFISLLTLGAIVAPVSILATSCASKGSVDTRNFTVTLSKKSSKTLLNCATKDGDFNFGLNHDGEWSINGSVGPQLSNISLILLYGTTAFAEWDVTKTVNGTTGKITLLGNNWTSYYRPSWVKNLNKK